MKKTLSILQATLLLLLIISPAVNAEEREQSIDVDFRSDVESPYRQNLLSVDELTLNMDTWAIQPKGVYSGPIMAETLIEYDFNIRPNQANGNMMFSGTHGFYIPDDAWSGSFDPGYGLWFGADWDFQGDISCTYAGANPTYGNVKYTHPMAPLTGPSVHYGECPLGSTSNSNDGVEDPYGNDDLMKKVHISRTPVNSYDWESDVRIWGEESYVSYISVSVPVEFSHQDIMSGASEFWVRSPIDGGYDPANSYLSIFEIDDLSYNDYDVNLKVISNSTPTNNEWDEPLAYSAPGTIKNTEVNHANGTLTYSNTLNGHEALAFDYTEANCVEINNGTVDPDQGQDPYIVSNGKRMGTDHGLWDGTITDYPEEQEMVQFFCPESNFPHFTSDTIPVDSKQTLRIPSLVHQDYNRTYHKVNSFIYPNQPYLFVFFLELTESNPLLALTSEDINGPGQETLIKYGEYNFSNPYDGDNLEYFRKPFNHFYNEDSIALDSGTSFVFTQGQSQDMAGYRINADNTTISFMKELPEPISHDPGPDGVFDQYDDDIDVNDDELDFVSIYLPFINHDKKDLTIEYVAMAYEIKEDGDIFLKQWLNSSRLDYADDDNGGTKGPQDDPYAHECDSTYGGMSGWDFIQGYECNGYTGASPAVEATPEIPFTEGAHNYYYSGFWYLGYPDEGISVLADTPKTGYADHHCFDDHSPVWASDEYTFCRSDDFQRRGGALNDENANGDFFRKQYKDYFLHTSELVPQNGTTHILYQFKIAGTHHWQANLENVCFYCDGTAPFTNADFTNNHDGDEIHSITKFPSNLDSDNDGRTDMACDTQPCQGNSTDITLLIQKPSVTPSEMRVPLPYSSVGSNATCSWRQQSSQVSTWEDQFTYMNASAEGLVCPYRYSAPLNSWSIYQEEWDRGGKWIDGATHQLMYYGLSGAMSAYDCYHSLSLIEQSINPTGWNGIKQCLDDENTINEPSIMTGQYADGCTSDYADPADWGLCGWSGILETNARGSTYLSISGYEYHSTELMASATVTHGRWTEVKGSWSGGVDYLDNTFRHKVVQRNVYDLTIVTSNYEVPECPIGYVEYDSIQCISEEEMALLNGYHDSINVLGKVGDACNPVEIVDNPTSWDVEWDWEWGACSSSIKNAIVGLAEYDWGTLIDGAQVVAGKIMDDIIKLKGEIGALGNTIVQWVTDAVGVLFSLFHEIGAHMDEIITGFLYLAGLLGLSFFLQMIIRFGATILIAIERRGAA
jgi:hypothetical protein